MTNFRVNLEAYDDEQSTDGNQRRNQTEHGGIQDYIGCGVSARGHLLDRIRGQSWIGDNLQKRADRNDIAPEPIYFYAQAPDQEREGQGSYGDARHARPADRGYEPAIAKKCFSASHDIGLQVFQKYQEP